MQPDINNKQQVRLVNEAGLTAYNGLVRDPQRPWPMRFASGHGFVDERTARQRGLTVALGWLAPDDFDCERRLLHAHR